LDGGKIARGNVNSDPDVPERNARITVGGRSLGRGGIIGKEPEHDGLEPWRGIGNTAVENVGTEEMRSALIHGIGEGASIESGIVDTVDVR